VRVSDAIKKTAPDSLPFPAAIKGQVAAPTAESDDADDDVVAHETPAAVPSVEEEVLTKDLVTEKGGESEDVGNGETKE
ncbi:MAG: hypothetical protein AAEC10_07035, partial [Rhodospirillales bacterium]